MPFYLPFEPRPISLFYYCGTGRETGRGFCIHQSRWDRTGKGSLVPKRRALGGEARGAAELVDEARQDAELRRSSELWIFELPGSTNQAKLTRYLRIMVHSGDSG